MTEKKKSKAQLIQELAALRRRMAELEKAEIKHRRTEEALKKSEDALRNLFNYSEVAMFRTRLDGSETLNANEKLLEIVGRTREEVIGKPSVGYWADPRHREEMIHRLKIKGRLVDFDCKMVSKKGQVRDCLISMNYYPEEGILDGSVLDITERKRIEEALKISEEKFRIIFENNAVAIAIIEPDTSFSMVNDFFCQTTGYTKEELTGMSWTQLIPSADLEKLKEINRRRLLDPQDAPDKYEITYHHKNGERRYAIASLFVIPASKQIIGSVVDITDRKRAEEKIRSLLQEKELLLKEVHHRIRNNMNTMMSLLSLQAHKLQDPVSVSALGDAKSRLQSMLVLYDKLYCTENLREMSIKEYLPDLVDEIIGVFLNKESVKIEIRIDDFTLGVKILSPLGIIVNELLTNIMKHAFSGQEEGVISLSATLKNRLARLVIEDNGKRIPESIDFDSSSGFGLGLVALLTKQINGAIRIDRGERNRFILEFKV